MTKTDQFGSNAYFDAYQWHCTENLTSTECVDEEMNPENTGFTSPYYQRHFAENWYSDQLRIFKDGSSGKNFISF